MPTPPHSLEDEDSTRKKELVKAYERIGVLETRVHDLTLQATLVRTDLYEDNHCKCIVVDTFETADSERILIKLMPRRKQHNVGVHSCHVYVYVHNAIFEVQTIFPL